MQNFALANLSTDVGERAALVVDGCYRFDRLGEFALCLGSKDVQIIKTISMRGDYPTTVDKFLAYGIEYINCYRRAHPVHEMIH